MSLRKNSFAVSLALHSRGTAPFGTPFIASADNRHSVAVETRPGAIASSLLLRFLFFRIVVLTQGAKLQNRNSYEMRATAILGRKGESSTWTQRLNTDWSCSWSFWPRCRCRRSGKLWVCHFLPWTLICWWRRARAGLGRLRVK